MEQQNVSPLSQHSLFFHRSWLILEIKHNTNTPSESQKTSTIVFYTEVIAKIIQRVAKHFLL
jgi:hypothetical protein